MSAGVEAMAGTRRIPAAHHPSSTLRAVLIASLTNAPGTSTDTTERSAWLSFVHD